MSRCDAPQEPWRRSACSFSVAATSPRPTRLPTRGTRIQKEHKHSTRRINHAVAAVMAHDVAATLETGPQMWIFDD
jgi:hypothetical protein